MMKRARTNRTRTSARPRMTTTSKRRHRARFGTDLIHLPEPQLEFRFGQKMVYPRDGLFLYGPVGDVRELPVIRYGVIGTSEGVRRFGRWATRVRNAIPIPNPG